MKSIYENLGGTYKANGDYSLPTFVLPKEEPFEIGVWGQRYLRHLKENHRIIYYPFQYEANKPTIHKIGGRYFEVSSRFDDKGTESVLHQFIELLKQENLI